jgi:hypothetical protein
MTTLTKKRGRKNVCAGQLFYPRDTFKVIPSEMLFPGFLIFMVYIATKQNCVGSEPFFPIHISTVMQKDQRTAYTENSITRMWNIQYMTIPKCLGFFAYKDATMPF